MYSSESESFRLEEQVSLLQDKLMETHNKLIDQLDICKEQELTIIQLTKKLYQLENSNAKPVYDNFKYQSFGANNDSFKENYENNFKQSKSTQSKTDLLQADLEAMRSKVLSEITEKNKIKDELKEIKAIHKKQLSAHQKKIEQIEGFIKKISQENEELKEKVEKIRRQKQKQIPQQQQIDKLLQKVSNLQQKCLKQRMNSKQISKERQQLQNNLLQQRMKVSQLEKQLDKKEKESSIKQKAYSILTESNIVSSHQQKQIDALKFQIQKLNKNVEMRDQEFKQGVHERKKKRGYEQTKELIRKLEETESSVRKSKKTNVY